MEVVGSRVRVSIWVAVRVGLQGKEPLSGERVREGVWVWGRGYVGEQQTWRRALSSHLLRQVATVHEGEGLGRGGGGMNGKGLEDAGLWR